VVLHLDANPAVSWMSTLQEPYGTQAGQWDTELGYWRWIHGTLGFDLTPVSAPYAASNIASGMTRPEVGANLWISDRHQPLPQAVTVEWPEPVYLNEVELTFDSQLSGWIWEGTFPLVARDYDVEVRTEPGAWQVVASVDGNLQRRRVHTFERTAASALRVTIRATNGGNTARIVEIRAYDESNPLRPNSVVYLR
jgi:hypothetical protein